MNFKLLGLIIPAVLLFNIAFAQKQPTLLSATMHITKSSHEANKAFYPAGIQAAKGSLIVPVTNANLVSQFGYYDIPGTKLKGNNPGISLEVPVWGEVKTVFDGNVKSVFKIDDNYVITIQHENITTVYAHLTKVVVKPGEKVYTGDVIGGVEKSLLHNGVIEFMVVEGMQNVDPLLWINTTLLVQPLQ